MDAYTTLVGARHPTRTPAPDLYAIATRRRDDDGARVPVCWARRARFYGR